MNTSTRTTLAAALTAGLAVTGIAAVAAPANAATTSYTKAQVRTHSTPSDCWTIIGRNVYDLTSFVGQHDGGSSAIISLCGKNGTKAFRSQHGSSGQASQALAAFKVGVRKR